MVSEVIQGGKAIIKPDCIEAFIYDQEGNLQPFKIANNKMNQYFIQWLQRHDRCTS